MTSSTGSNVVPAYSAVLNRTSAGSAAFSLKLATPATAVKRFGSLGDTQFFTVNALDLAAQVKALQAIVDRKVSKKKYNTLARKWNAAFPSQKVALKK